MIHGMSTSAQEQEAKSFIFQAFGYDIENINLLHVALDLSQAAAHKRLALLGDAALRAAALDEWYATPNSIEYGQNLVQHAGNNKRLASVAEDMGLAAYLKHHPGQLGNVSPKSLAAAMEAILGAIFLDSDKSIEMVANAMHKANLL